MSQGVLVFVVLLLCPGATLCMLSSLWRAEFPLAQWQHQSIKTMHTLISFCSCSFISELSAVLIDPSSVGYPCKPKFTSHIAAAVNNITWILYGLACSKNCCHELYRVLIKTPITHTSSCCFKVLRKSFHATVVAVPGAPRSISGCL